MYLDARKLNSMMGWKGEGLGYTDALQASMAQQAAKAVLNCKLEPGKQGVRGVEVATAADRFWRCLRYPRLQAPCISFA